MINKMKVLVVAVVIGFVFAVAPQPASAHEHGGYSHDASINLNREDWMRTLPDDVRLSELSLPGTHDTLSFYGGDAVQTQSMPLRTQLDAGIRVLDIRTRHIEDSFAIHHGMVFQHAYFGADVMEVAIDFLEDNPSETVLMRVKEEYNAHNNTRTYQETFAWYMSIYGDHVWDPTSSNPTMSEVRGQIVILQDFSGTLYGIDYDRLDIQDNYSLDTNWDLYDKWLDVKAQLRTARYGDSNTIYMNYLSGAVGSFPYFVASGHSSPGTSAPRLSTGLTTPGWSDSYPDFPRVDCFLGICTIAFEGTNVLTAEWLRDHPDAHVGILMADFPGPALINQIINRNPINFEPLVIMPPYYVTRVNNSLVLHAAGIDHEGATLEYRWNTDGVPGWDTDWSTQATTQVSYSQVGPVPFSVQVTDGAHVITVHGVINVTP